MAAPPSAPIPSSWAAVHGGASAGKVSGGLGTGVGWGATRCAAGSASQGITAGLGLGVGTATIREQATTPTKATNAACLIV